MVLQVQLEFLTEVYSNSVRSQLYGETGDAVSPALKWAEGLTEPTQRWAGALSLGPARGGSCSEGSENLCAAAFTEGSLKSTALGSQSASQRGFSGENSWKWGSVWLGEVL